MNNTGTKKGSSMK